MILIGHLIDQLGACTFDRAVADHDPQGVGWRVSTRTATNPSSCAPAPPTSPSPTGTAVASLATSAASRSARPATPTSSDITGALPPGDRDGKLYLSAEGAVQGGMLEFRAIGLSSNPAMTLRPIQVSSGTLVELADAKVLQRCATATRAPRRC